MTSSRGSPFYREIFDATSDGLIIHDPRGRILDANRQACSMFGYSREEILSRTLGELSLGSPPYTEEEAIGRLRRAAQGEPQTVRWRSRRQNGELFWSEVALRAYEMEGQTRVIASLRDITERVDSEERLRRKNEMLLGLNAYSLDLAAVPFTENLFQTITESLKTLTNARAVSVSVYDAETSTLIVKHSTLSGEDQKRFVRFLGRRLEGMRVKVSPEMYERMTTEVIGDAGTLSETTFGAIPPGLGSLVEKALGIGWFTGMAMLHDGNLIGTVVMAGDTESRRPEKEEFQAFSGVTANALRRWLSEQSSSLHEAQARQERGLSEGLLDSLPGIFFQFDGDLRLRRWNQALQEATGLTSGELNGRFLGEWFESRADRERMLDQARSLLRKGGFSQFEIPILLRGGRSVPYLLRTGSLSTPGGPTILGVGIDISEQARLQEQLQQAQKMEAVGRLAGGVAHDFNNLLTVISGNLELARAELKPSDPLQETLVEIERAASSAVSLTSQLLAFSRRQIIEPRVLDLNVLVRNLHSMLVRLIGEDIELVMELAHELPFVKVDPGQFEQVLVNLAVNARDAMPDGGRLTIGTSIAEFPSNESPEAGEVPGTPCVLLTVNDTGQGMDEEVQRHLFEPFFTTKAQGRGTGLGLATILGVVEQAGGSIRVASEPALGSTFRIFLPIVESPGETVAPEGEALGVRGGGETILVVEDEESVRALAIRFLKRLGYDTLSAGDGEEATLVAESHSGRIHLLITDVVMPGINGRELAQRMTARDPSMRVLFTSGYTEDVILRHGVGEEELDFIPKPYSLQVLGEKVEEILSR